VPGQTYKNTEQDARNFMEQPVNSDFVPPYPKRFEVPPSLLTRLQLARHSFLAIWCKSDFTCDIATIKVLRREIAIINSPDLVKQAFQENHAVLQRKSPQMRHALEPLLGDGLFVSDGEVWKARRKIVGPIIHGSKVPEFAPVMIQVMEEYAGRWAQKGDGSEIDVLSEMAEMTAEIICRTIFGQDLGQAFAQEIVKGFSDYQRHVRQIDIPWLLNLPYWFPRFSGKRVRKSTNRILSVLDEIIERYATERKPDDTSVIGALLDARDESGKPLSRKAVRNEAAVIFMAGHETTANTLAWAWYLISQSQAVRTKLELELDTIVGKRAIQFSDVRKLTYTRAITDETLRLYPPVPMLAREAAEDITIGSRRFHKGSILIVVAWLLHRNPRLWPDADAFRPERFLNERNSKKHPKPNKYAYVPFSTGPRICAGLIFGQTETILAIAVLSQKFRLELKPGTEVQPICRLTLRPGDELPMIVRDRS
jgi:cytochrome P450